MKTFKKGDLVTHFISWDNKGTVAFRQCKVYSCGKKDMVLTDVRTGKEVGRHFKPVVATGYAQGTRFAFTDQDAEYMARLIGEQFVKEERARLEGLITHYGYPETDGYTKSIRSSIAALHAPEDKKI